MLLTAELSALAGAAFVAEGYDGAFGAVRVSDRPDLAQFQCNGALGAAKSAGQNPRALGEKIAARLKADPLFAAVSVAGPGFINLTLTDEALSARLNGGAGGWRAETPETIIVDYGGPNIAKPLHVGHLRAAIIGECMKRLIRAAGHAAIGDIHMGDWGLPMGQLITEIARDRPDLPYFDPAFEGPYPDQSPVTLEDLERLYPQASAACKADPARAAEARAATAALQAGRPGYRALWKHFLAVSRASIEREYEDLGVTFDWWKGEADVDPLIAPMVEKLRAKGVAVNDNGAVVMSRIGGGWALALWQLRPDPLVLVALLPAAIHLTGQFVTLDPADGDDALALGHDAAEPVDRVQALHGGEKARATRVFHAAPCEIADPGRHARQGVDDVDVLLAQESSQLGHLQKRERILAADVPGVMLAAMGGELRHEPAAGGDDDGAMPPADEFLADLQRTALHAAAFQRWDELHDGHSVGHVLSREDNVAADGGGWMG